MCTRTALPSQLGVSAQMSFPPVSQTPHLQQLRSNPHPQNSKENKKPLNIPNYKGRTCEIVLASVSNKKGNVRAVSGREVDLRRSVVVARSSVESLALLGFAGIDELCWIFERHWVGFWGRMGSLRRLSVAAMLLPPFAGQREDSRARLLKCWGVGEKDKEVRLQDGDCVHLVCCVLQIVWNGALFHFYGRNEYDRSTASGRLGKKT